MKERTEEATILGSQMWNVVGWQWRGLPRRAAVQNWKHMGRNRRCGVLHVHLT